MVLILILRQEKLRMAPRIYLEQFWLLDQMDSNKPSHLSIDTDESWTDAESQSSGRPNAYVSQLKSMAHELEIIKVNVQFLLDRVLALTDEANPPA